MRWKAEKMYLMTFSYFFQLKYHDLSDKQFPPVTNKMFPVGL